MSAIFLIEMFMIVITFGLWMLSVGDGPGKPFLIGWAILVVVFVLWEYAAFGRVPIVGKETELNSYGVVEILKAFFLSLYDAYSVVVEKVSQWLA